MTSKLKPMELTPDNIRQLRNAIADVEYQYNNIAHDVERWLRDGRRRGNRQAIERGLDDVLDAIARLNAIAQP